jgi:uncharacterized protein (TIGR04551 family)
MRAKVLTTSIICLMLSWFSSAAAQGAPTAPAKKPAADARSPRKSVSTPAAAKADTSAQVGASAADNAKASAPQAPQVEPKAEPDAGPSDASASSATQSGATTEPSAAQGGAAAVPSAPAPGQARPTLEPSPGLLPSLEPAAAEKGFSEPVPTPGEAGDRLTRNVPESVKGQEQWTAPQPVVTLHGYYRMRGELQDSFWLGRAALPEEIPDPFTAFKPLERRSVPEGGCGDESTLDSKRCDISTLQFANMRLRLAPQLNVSDDVRVKMSFDLFDNMVAGTGATSYYGTYALQRNDEQSSQIFVASDEPKGQTIAVRQAWAEVRRRGLGELRFGRMPNHWGLGMVNNAGTGVDDDYSSSIDRVMGITKIAGVYVTAAYDFITDGLTKPNVSTGLPTDTSQLDDVDQFTFTLARRLSPEEQDTILESGGTALNGGGYFSYRVQDMYGKPAYKDEDGTDVADALYLIGGRTFTFDLWGQLRWRGIRIELEAALITGGMDNIDASAADENYKILSFGTALETEFRFLSDKLAVHFDSGLATGDGDVDGLSSVDDLFYQNGGHTVSTFRFNPAYRIDLILWRSIMRQVTGAYYFKPGISYDFIRSSFGQLFGGRLDVIWSRAASKRQTWGNGNDLGLELNASVYWRSEDGPEPIDGFHALVQWGMLFPLQGLGYTKEDEAALTNFDFVYPQNLRLVLGVVF